MSDELDLSGEQDVTDRMTEQQQQARERAERAENERESEFRGEMTTDSFSVEEALEGLTEQ